MTVEHPIDFTLIDKWQETKDEKYLNEWLGSNNAYHAALRISRTNTTKRIVSTYGLEYMSLNGEYIMPDLVSQVYLGMREVAHGYQSGKGATFYTYITNYSLHAAARHLTDVIHTADATNDASYDIKEVMSFEEEYDHQRAKYTLDEIIKYVTANYEDNNLRYYLPYLNGMSIREVSELTNRSFERARVVINRMNAEVRVHLGEQWKQGMI